ncbi:Peptidase M1 leukotriene A4 hydrolase/aminopeptidase C-terminal [Trinorchestia longiramus]|nr:Peptidase M1 leukotriene A4 hydrolase/aminopeptidase C-terminal [Trinorchestia longiramus]
MDPSSFSNPGEAKITGVHLDWTVDFEECAIVGSATLTVMRVQEDAKQLVVDSRDLKIKSVEDEDTKTALEFSVGERHDKFGSAITITLPPGTRAEEKVTVHYETSPASTALQWLTPEQTADKVAPYVFSQCQPIHCRSLAPLQDSPALKFPYTARVRVPPHLTALMSAGCSSVDAAAADTSYRTYEFEQKLPIPSYLLAIVVGELESRRLAPNISVWSEPSVVDKAAQEFVETERMLKAAEAVCGDYLWQRYDLVILPPSFPYGGMENPCLTFVSPTVLAGDKSAVDVVIHEICHSWTGNLVTNCKWADFWLNEGFTMFVQRKVEGALHGDAFRHFSAIEGWKSLSDCVHNAFKPGDPLTALVPDLTNVDPDDAFSTIPYEKGHTLLWYLEELLGGPAVFDPFLRSYLARFSKQSVSTEQFRAYLTEYFSDQRDKLDAVDWDTWLYSPGMPPYTPQFDDQLAWVCAELEKTWLTWQEGEECPASPSDLNDLNTKQIIDFLERLFLQEQPLPIFKLEAMARLYDMWQRQNCEIRLRWLRVCVKARWEEAVAPALQLVTEQGRMKFVRPIYRELHKWGGGVRQRAIDNFLAHEDEMMHVAAHAVLQDLQLQEHN